MATAIRMPALGQTSDELRLVAWLKSEGEVVNEGDELFEAESDKAVHEVEAAYSGTLLRVLAEPGEMIKTGTVIGWLGEPGETVPAEPETEQDTSDQPAPVQPAASESSTVADPGRVLATPAARRIARERGIDLATVNGSGPGGRIETDDLVAAGGDAVQAAPAGAADQPVATHRQAIARRLTQAAGRPQFTVSRTLDARAALARVASVEQATLTHLLLQALGSALAQFPRVNRLWIDDGPYLRELPSANVGLAIAADDRLVVATVVEPHRQELADLAQSVRETVRQGREGRLPAAANSPAAVSLSNLGMFGVDRFEAIIDPDQTAILAVGRVLERPAITAEGITAVPQVELTLAVDHRTVDGAEAGQFLQAICAYLEG